MNEPASIPDKATSKKYTVASGLFSWKLLGIALAVSGLSAVLLYYLTSTYIINQAENNIRDLLLTHKGVHHYVQKIMHPALYDYQSAGEIADDFYAPELFSSSYIVRNMHALYNEERLDKDLPTLYYKMAAYNPRNPVNKADAMEEKLIHLFDQNRDLKEYREIVEMDGKRYLYYAQPFLENTEACLRCHGDREDAPTQLQARYPGLGGFKEKIGDIRAIISVRAPLEREFSIINIVLLAALTGISALWGLLLLNQRLKNTVRIRTENLRKEMDERLLIETRLRDSEKRFRTLVEQAADAIFVHDLDGRLIDVNQRACESLGYTKDELLNLQVKDIETSFADPGFAQQLLDRLSAKGSLTEEGLQRRRDGSTFPVEVSLGWFDIEGERYVLALARDISKRKQAEEKLKNNEKKYRRLLESISTVPWELDLATREFTYIGPQALEIFGYPLETWTNFDRWTAMLHPDDRAHTVNFCLHAAERGEDHDSFYRIMHANGSIVWIHDIVSVIMGPSGPEKLVGFMHDITDAKRVESEKNRLETQLRQAQKMEAIGTLAGGIAHDFNNILAIILGFTDLAIEDMDPTSQTRSELAEVLIAANRAKELVRQILAFSRKAEQELQPIKPQAVIIETMKMLRATIPSTVEIQQDISPECGTIIADPTQIHQVLMNLCTNAVHAMQEKGTLYIGLDETSLTAKDISHRPDMIPGRHMRLTISDTGSGMDQTTVERIFDPFFTTKDVGEGTGMGLSVVLGIVLAHHGLITVASDPGKGTTFHVYFAIAQKEESELLVQATSLPTGNERILLVDDESMMTDMGSKLLERQGYHVTTENSSFDALKLFRSNPDDFDLVITDQTMPGLTGAELARKILAIKPEMPIILCTGYSSQISADQAKDIGIKEFLLKPVDRRRIALLTRKALDDAKK